MAGNSGVPSTGSSSPQIAIPMSMPAAPAPATAATAPAMLGKAIQGWTSDSKNSGSISGFYEQYKTDRSAALTQNNASIAPADIRSQTMSFEDFEAAVMNDPQNSSQGLVDTESGSKHGWLSGIGKPLNVPNPAANLPAMGAPTPFSSQTPSGTSTYSAAPGAAPVNLDSSAPQASATTFTPDDQARIARIVNAQKIAAAADNGTPDGKAKAQAALSVDGYVQDMKVQDAVDKQLGINPFDANERAAYIQKSDQNVAYYKTAGMPSFQAEQTRSNDVKYQTYKAAQDAPCAAQAPGAGAASPVSSGNPTTDTKINQMGFSLDPANDKYWLLPKSLQTPAVRNLVSPYRKEQRDAYMTWWNGNKSDLDTNPKYKNRLHLDGKSTEYHQLMGGLLDEPMFRVIHEMEYATRKNKAWNGIADVPLVNIDWAKKTLSAWDAVNASGVGPGDKDQWKKDNNYDGAIAVRDLTTHMKDWLNGQASSTALNSNWLDGLKNWKHDDVRGWFQGHVTAPAQGDVSGNADVQAILAT